MKVICTKNYGDLIVGDITTFLPRRNGDLTNPTYNEVCLDFPVGAVDRKKTGTYQLISYVDFVECFSTIREFRKLKLEKINASNL